MKKKRQNAKRSKGRDPSTEAEKPKESEESVKPENPEKPMARAESEEATEAEGAAALEFDEDMVEHLGVQASLLEGRQVSREETIEMLRRVMRQRSMAGESRRDYVVRFLREKEENPP